MSTANIEEIVDTLSQLSVLELANLKKALEDKWEVTAQAAAPVAMMAAPAGGDAAPAEESTEFQVSLTDVPAAKKIAVIKVIREVSGLGLKEAKEVAESTPKVLKESVSQAEADEIKKKFEEAGAKVEVKGL